MQITLTFSVTLQLLAVILGALTGVILWIYPRKGPSSNKLFGTSLIAISFGLFIAFLIETRLILQVPHLYRLGNLFGLLFMPLSYLYVRSIVWQEKLHARDIVHTIAPLLFIVDYMPFYLLSADEKIALLQQDLIDLDKLLLFQQGWLLPQNFHLPFRNLVILAYWLLQLRLLLQAKARLDYTMKVKNRHWLQWIQIVTAFQLFFFLPYFIALLVDMPQYSWDTTTLIFALFFVFITLYMFLRPDILYGIKGTNIPTEKTAGKPSGPQGMQYLDKEKVNAVKEQIAALMEKKAVYLQHNFSLQNLSEELNVPYYQLSAIINRETQMNFNDYLNSYRVQHCIKRMKNGESKNITLEALGYECGFNNRNSFTQSFKKVTGLTPSAFVKQLEAH